MSADATPIRCPRGGDVGFAVGIVLVLCLFFLPVPSIMIDFGLALFHRAVRADPDGGACGFRSRWSSRPSRRCCWSRPCLRLALNISTTRLILSHGDSGGDGRRLHHRRLRAAGDGRRLRHRHHRLSHPRHDQLPRHHQGRDAYRRSRRALHARRHPRQADGDRRRPLRRADRREDRAAAPARARGGKRLLRLDGRRLEIRARRRDRRPHHSRRQHLRRNRHRRHPPRHVADERRRRVHQAVGRRRPRLADPRAHHLARGRPARRQGRHARLGGKGGARPTQPLPDRAVHGRGSDVDPRRHARPAAVAVRLAERPARLRRLRDPGARAQGRRGGGGGARDAGWARARRGARLDQGAAEAGRDRAVLLQGAGGDAALAAWRDRQPRRQDAAEVRARIRLRRAGNPAHRRDQRAGEDLSDPAARHDRGDAGAARPRTAGRRRRRAASVDAGRRDPRAGVRHEGAVDSRGARRRRARARASGPSTRSR